MAEQHYPHDRYRVIVVADNCTDDTADIARQAGAQTLERRDLSTRGKGHALRWAMDRLLDSDQEIDAFVVVDADSITDPGMLVALAVRFSQGAEVAQADYGALVDGEDPKSQIRAAAFLLFHRVRFSGKARLGLPCNLVGNGMLFSREIAQRHPWSAFSEVEDLEYGLQLRLEGVEPVFVINASLVAPVSSSGRAAEVQRARWEGGRIRITREYLPRMIREMVVGRRFDLWDAAVDLAVPPVSVLAAITMAGTAGAFALRATGVVGTAALAPWVVASAALPAHVLIGLRAGDAPPPMRRALASSPQLLVGEMVTRTHALRRRSGDAWVRTPRGSESELPADQKVVAASV